MRFCSVGLSAFQSASLGGSFRVSFPYSRMESESISLGNIMTGRGVKWLSRLRKPVRMRNHWHHRVFRFSEKVRYNQWKAAGIISPEERRS
jgi:hypothetical protein